MSYLTSSELALVRSRPQSSRLFLSIYQPKVVFKAQVNNVSGTWGDSTILYDNVSTGVWSDIVAGQTMLIGSYDGGRDFGRIRVKSATGTYVQVAENDDSYFGDNAYLTVLDYHELFPVYAMIGNHLDSDGDIVLFPDGDIAYVNQGLNLGSMINMGTHYAGFIENPVYYSASGTVQVKGDAITSYDWVFEGASSGISNAQTPGNIYYPNAGHFTTELTVTDVNGMVDHSYRHISIYDHNSQRPIESWGIDSLQGSRDEGGYTASLWIRENVDYLVDGALAVIFSDDVYESTDVSLGGNASGRNKILFVGYVTDNSIMYDSQSSKTTFEVSSITGLMKKKNGFSVSIDSKIAPTKWQQGYDLNMERSIYYFYRWYTTLLEVADVRYIGENLPIQYLETEMDNLYDGMNTFLKNCIVGGMVSDRQGTIFVEPGIEITNGATGIYPVTMSVLKQDWVDQPTITVHTLNPTSSLEMGGFSFSGAGTNISNQFLAQSPGYAPSYSGQPEQGEAGLTLIDQTDLNIKTGNKFAYLNARYPEINLKLAGAFRNIDITPYEQVLINIQPPDTNYGLTMVDKSYHPLEISMTYDAENGVLQSNLTLHEVTQGFPAETVDIPVPIVDNYQTQPLIPWDDFDFSITPWELNPPAMITTPSTEPCDTAIFSGAESNSIVVGGLIGTYESSGIKTHQATPVDCMIRPSSLGVTKTTYKIDGSFLERTVIGALGAFTPTINDAWYHVYLLRSGHRIAEGTHDAVNPNNPGVRTGYFNLPTGTYVNGMEIALDEQKWDISTVLIDHNAIGVGHIDSEKLTYDLSDPSILRLTYNNVQENYYPVNTYLTPSRISGDYLGYWFEAKFLGGSISWTSPSGDKHWTAASIGRCQSSLSFTPLWGVGITEYGTYAYPAPQVFQYQVDNAVHPQQGVFFGHGNDATIGAGQQWSAEGFKWEIKMFAKNQLVVNNFRLYNVCGQSTYQNSGFKGKDTMRGSSERGVTSANTDRKNTVIGGGRQSVAM